MDSVIGFHENGDSSLLIKYGQKNYTKVWNQLGIVVEDYSYLNSGLLAGAGHFTNNDTIYRYTLSDSIPSDYSPLKVWVISGKDTLRMDYIRNNMNFHKNIGQFILSSNHYIKDPKTGLCVEDGVWKYYTGNDLSHVLTFKQGIREGRAIFYTSGNDPKVASKGMFLKGKRSGEWITYSDSGNYVITYTDGEETGPFTYYYPSGNTKVTGYREKGSITGIYSEYHENKTLKIQIPYVDGKQNGYRSMYDEKGRIVNSGEVYNNTAVGKWYFYEYDDKGDVKRSKKKYIRKKELKRTIHVKEPSNSIPLVTKVSRSQNPYDGSLLC
jgi:antitoxin component YwqK of YwqJK toxin-antitoxin module